MDVVQLITNALLALAGVAIASAGISTAVRATFAPGPWRAVLAGGAALNAIGRIALVAAVAIAIEHRAVFEVSTYVLFASEAAIVAAVFMLPNANRREATP